MNSSSSSSTMDPVLTPTEIEELRVALDAYSKDRARIQQDINRVAFVGTLAGFVIGKSGGDALLSGRVPFDYSSPPSSYPSSFRIPRLFGSRTLRIPMGTFIGIVGALVGGTCSTLYFNQTKQLVQALDRQYLRDDYGATIEQMQTLSIYGNTPHRMNNNNSSSSGSTNYRTTVTESAASSSLTSATNTCGTSKLR